MLPTDDSIDWLSTVFGNVKVSGFVRKRRRCALCGTNAQIHENIELRHRDIDIPPVYQSENSQEERNANAKRQEAQFC